MKNATNITANPVKSKESIISSIVSAHAISGCDTVASCDGVGKMTVIVKNLKEGKKLSVIGQLEADMNNVIEKATQIVSHCYGHPFSTMTECKIKQPR